MAKRFKGLLALCKKADESKGKIRNKKYDFLPKTENYGKKKLRGNQHYGKMNESMGKNEE